MIIQDAKGKPAPANPRYVENIAAAGAIAGYAESSGNLIPFSLYLAEDSVVVFTTVENIVNKVAEEITFSFGAGYHPLGFTSIISTVAPALACYASRPQSA